MGGNIPRQQRDGSRGPQATLLNGIKHLQMTLLSGRLSVDVCNDQNGKGIVGVLSGSLLNKSTVCLSI